ncbi:MAG TPA: hypothetical protein DCL35_07570 [Candidatus Omnitrophica bacterium]|nr:hypothetical protein [Candidatus Omnitrophota bacterium]
MSALYDIYLRRPRIEANRIIYSWAGFPLLGGESFWIEYPESVSLEDSSYEVLAPYLAACLAFAAFGKVRAHLPVRLDEAVLGLWLEFIRGMAAVVYRRAFAFEFVNGTERAEQHFWEGKETALLFGGGTESLLCLARLRQDGLNPVLVGLCGPNWEGSNEEINPHKFELQDKAAKDMGLASVKVRTSFREVFKSHDELWKGLLLDGTHNIVTTALFSVFPFTFLFPVAAQWRLSRVVAGNEKDNNAGKFFYASSAEATGRLKGLHPCFSYDSYLNDIYKMDVARELFLKYPQYLPYHYSCIPNQRQRWCLECPKCLCSYLYYKLYNIPPAVAGFDEALIAKRMPNLIWRCRWHLVSGDPGEPLDYLNFLREAQASGNQEVVSIIRQMLDNIWWIRFLNFFRRLGIVQAFKKPLKKVFYLLHGHSIKI